MDEKIRVAVADAKREEAEENKAMIEAARADNDDIQACHAQLREQGVNVSQQVVADLIRHGEQRVRAVSAQRATAVSGRTDTPLTRAYTSATNVNRFGINHLGIMFMIICLCFPITTEAVWYGDKTTAGRWCDMIDYPKGYLGWVLPPVPGSRANQVLLHESSYILGKSDSVSSLSAFDK